MVTIASAAMIVWFSPSTMVRLDIGSRTPESRWRPVAPRDVAASTVVVGTSRMP